ncbi:hypothetical protein TNCV_3090501 [Trichonephila clavipes]|nr:hypothetical protein TNCV_3090501 [Trichonephila clavipes]
MPSPVQFNCDAHDTIANGQYGAVWSMGHTQQLVDLNIPMKDSPKWFEGAKLNFTENVLKYRDDRLALIVDEELFRVLGEFGEVGGQQLVFLEASQTCSIGFMSGEHAGHSISAIPSSNREILHQISMMWPAVIVH